MYKWFNISLLRNSPFNFIITLFLNTYLLLPESSKKMRLLCLLPYQHLSHSPPSPAHSPPSVLVLYLLIKRNRQLSKWCLGRSWVTIKLLKDNSPAEESANVKYIHPGPTGLCPKGLSKLVSALSQHRFLIQSIPFSNTFPFDEHITWMNQSRLKIIKI